LADPLVHNLLLFRLILRLITPDNTLKNY